MNTHSHVIDARLETLAAHAALAGASRQVIADIMQCVSTDAALDAMKEAGVMDQAMRTLTERAAYHVRHRLGADVRAELVFFSKVHGLLSKTPGADELVACRDALANVQDSTSFKLGRALTALPRKARGLLRK